MSHFLKISYLKSSDDEDYYEFDIDEKECVISDLKFIKTSDNCYEIQFGAKIEISDEKWDGADKKFKENAQEGHIEGRQDIDIGERIESIKVQIQKGVLQKEEER